MKGHLVVFVTLFAAIQAAEISKLTNPKWVAYKAEYNKHYKNVEEELKRMKTFFESIKEIEEHNLKFDRGLFSYKMSVNTYSDMDLSEFVKTMNGFKKAPKTSGSASKKLFRATFNEDPDPKIPDSINWRKLGAVTEVKDQGECGSGWAFAATGSLEGQHFRRYGELVSMSEQNLIDCSTTHGNSGCNYGDAYKAFDYVIENKGINTETSYPYEAKDGKCRYNPTNHGTVIDQYFELPYGDEDMLKTAVAQMGPIAVAIDATSPRFQHYSEGIYREANCSSTDTNHAVLVVGYGIENGSDYWLVKNSWGSDWGEGGYVKMPRNERNHCGIASDAAFPFVPQPNPETNNHVHIAIKIQIQK